MSYENLMPHKTVPPLFSFLVSNLDKCTEIPRSSRIGCCLLITGCDRKNNSFNKLKYFILKSQKSDGGWVDVEETTWNLAFLRKLGYSDQVNFKRGLTWLHTQRHHEGGYGRINRDIPRIPTTGLLLYLLPELSDQDAVNWLIDEWGKDIQCETRLTYKGGFFLMGLSASGVAYNDCSLIGETYSFLAQEQNDDGGFGPWKDHPIGSDPWSTGIVLLGLLSYPDMAEREVIERAVNWLAENQLPNGLWPYHYIEEGSAYAYWGLVEALKYLAKKV